MVGRALRARPSRRYTLSPSGPLLLSHEGAGGIAGPRLTVSCSISGISGILLGVCGVMGEAGSADPRLSHEQTVTSPERPWRSWMARMVSRRLARAVRDMGEPSVCWK